MPASQAGRAEGLHSEALPVEGGRQLLEQPQRVHLDGHQLVVREPAEVHQVLRSRKGTRRIAGRRRRRESRARAGRGREWPPARTL